MQGDIKIVLFQAVLLSIQGLSYLLVQHSKQPVRDMARSMDQKIPLIPQCIFIYVLWYPLIAVFPLMLHHYAVDEYAAYIMSIILDIVISLAVYWIYPTSFTRPKPPTDCLSGKLLGLIYIVDYKGKNCMPSMHCSMCFIIIIYALCSCEMGIGLQTLICGLSAMIVASTVLTKQHVLVDVITALPLAVVCCVFGQMIAG